MNRRLSLCLVALLGSGCFLQSAYGQTPAPAPAAPAGASPTTMTAGVPALKLDQSQAPDLTAQQAMQNFVTGHLGVIVGGSPAEQAKARDLLITAMPHKSAPNIAVAYVDMYAKILDDSLVNLLKSNPPLRVKLLVGVVAAKAAERAEDASTPLSDTAEELLQDQSEAILLWGMKTTKYVLPGKLNGAAAMYKSLLERIVPVGSAHPGPVLEEAYQALTLETLNLRGNSKLLSDPSVVSRVKVVIPHVQALLNKRIADWAAGAPKYPLAEKDATGFLTIPGVWPLQNPVQQKQTMMSIYDLLLKSSNAFMNAQGKDREELKDLIVLVSGAMSTIGDLVKDPVLQGASKDLRKITPGASNQMVQGWLAALTNAYNDTPLIKNASTAGGPTTQTSIVPVGQAAATK